MKLRPYQLRSIELLRQSIIKGAEAPILCLPTGAGKTVTFSHLAQTAINKGSKIHVVCHRMELIHQAKDTLNAYGVNINNVYFNMVQTLTRTPKKIPKAELTIIDECHIGNFRKFCDLVNGKTQIIGVTATPLSASKKNPLNKTFDKVISPIQISELIDNGYLSKPTYHIARINEDNLKLNTNGEFSESSQNTTYSNLFNIENLKEAINQCKGKTIIFCASIEMAEKVSDLCRGILVHSKMKLSERNARVKFFKSQDNSIIVNCSILTAGFDDPMIKNVIVYRATTSLTLWLQMVGRGSRLDTGTFNVYDLGNNVKRLGSWDLKRDWEKLFNEQGEKIKEGEAVFKNCVSCEALIYASMTRCNVCNKEQPKKVKKDAVSEGFEVIEYGQNIPIHLQKKWDQMTLKELIERAKYGSTKTGRPYHIGWVVNQLKARPNYNQLIHELASLKGYSKGWIYRQIK